MGGSVELSLSLKKYFYNEMEFSIKNNTDLDVKKITEKLCTFCFSEAFIPFICFEILFDFQFTVSLYEIKEKFLSIKILFHLLEELKKKNFENHIIAIIKNNKDFLNIIQQFYINNLDSIYKISVFCFHRFPYIFS